MRRQADQASGLGDLLRDYSLEMNAKDVSRLEEAAPLIPPGTAISITFLASEDSAARVQAAAAARRLGFQPVPHISARRAASEKDLEAFLAGLAREAGIDRVFVVAGDLPRPEGPFTDALDIIKTGLLGKYGVEQVGISGYPEGHPDISDASLWQALRDKLGAAEDQGHDAFIMTQFGFDADPVLDWLERARREGVSAPVRIGVAGPTSVKALLRFAARCGVGASAKVLAKYGVSITRLLTTAGPDPIIEALGRGLDPARHGETRLHFYPFGGFLKTAEWIPDFRRSHGV
ncbi:MAG TPA: methylenetetrahydrofolate reductase [Phenylobacterium sp.]|nr:methylenetetrahydrofolate reductase [Phenylobacterium sp.]